MWVSRVDETESVRDTVQINNPLKLQNNAGGMRSPLSMNFRTNHRVDSVQNTGNEAGVVISISGGKINNAPQNHITSLSNIDMNLFAAD